jgi:thioredoxin 2
MTPVFKKVAQTSPTLLFAKIDTEKVQQVATKMNIRSLPTLVLFQQGKEINRISGGLNEMQMKQWIMQSMQKIAK